MALFIIPVIVFVGLDQLTKYIVSSKMVLDSSITVIPKIFELTYIKNDGAAFGMLSGKQTLLIIVTVVAMILISLYAIIDRKKLSKLEELSLGMIVGGGIGNLIGRITEGCVTDFFNIHIIPVFNVADIGITIGCLLLIIAVLKSK